MSVRKFAWLLLFVWALVCSACSVDVVAETSSPADQDGSVTVVTSTSVPVVSATETATSVVSSVVTTAIAMLDLSPAWIEAKEINRLFDKELPNDEDFVAEVLADSRFYDEYILENTNSILSSPMGALCWVVQELSRSHELYLGRIYADEWAEDFIGELGIVDENYNDQRPIDFLLGYLTGDITVEDDGDSGPVGIVNEDSGGTPGVSDSEESIEDDEWTKEDILTIYRDPGIIELLRNFGGPGDGTEWASAVRSVVSPEVRAAVGAGEGLPPDVQLYADALFRAVQDYIDSGQTEASSFYREDIPGFHNFVEAAKYSPDCKRLSIAMDELRGLL